MQSIVEYRNNLSVYRRCIFAMEARKDKPPVAELSVPFSMHSILLKRILSSLDGQPALALRSVRQRNRSAFKPRGRCNREEYYSRQRNRSWEASLSIGHNPSIHIFHSKEDKGEFLKLRRTASRRKHPASSKR